MNIFEADMFCAQRHRKTSEHFKWVLKTISVIISLQRSIAGLFTRTIQHVTVLYTHFLEKTACTMSLDQ